MSDTTTPEIPAYEMPSNPLRKKVITETIKFEIGKRIFDPEGPLLDIRTCAALIAGDDVKAVRDPEAMRKLLADDVVRASVLKVWPDVGVYYPS